MPLVNVGSVHSAEQACMEQPEVAITRMFRQKTRVCRCLSGLGAFPDLLAVVQGLQWKLTALSFEFAAIRKCRMTAEIQKRLLGETPLDSAPTHFSSFCLCMNGYMLTHTRSRTHCSRNFEYNEFYCKRI
jgi:hypothetical protein